MKKIPDRLEAFHKALDGMFGVGAEAIEKVIARNLYSRIGLNFEEHEKWTLADYVNYAEEERCEC